MIPEELPPRPLPPDLETAIRQARAGQPTPESVARLIAQASALATNPTGVTSEPPLHRGNWAGQIVSALVVAAASVAVCVILSQPPRGPELPAIITLAEPSRTYSKVTQTSLYESGLQQIDADLRQADLRLSQTTDALALAELRREVRQTLEEFRLKQ